MKKLAARIAAALVLLLIVTGVFFYRHPVWFLDRAIYYRLWRGHVVGKYIDVGTNRLHYYEAGDPNGTPLLLIHGLGSRGEDWSTLIPTFAAAGFHVYAPDLLGYGRSSRPDVDYSIALEESVVVQFMQAVHQPRASVIGWSMGGWIAMKLALDHPAMVDRLAVYDSAGTYFAAVLPPNLFTPNDVDGVKRLFDVLEPEPRTVPAFIERDSLHKLQKNSWIINRSLSSMISGRYLLDFRLGSLKQPMLIMWGGADHLIPPAVGEEIHKAVTHSVFGLVEGCGHLAPAECSKPFLEGTIAFLKSQPPMSSGETTYPKPTQ
ncbi:alpha/beta fold hydrolase [Granulicella arctica]|uniref:alpha/beta fold hydrolase n=1 Tax=Granulicella arctica TaxID=940613 RepID=UPI0021DFA868|nr:alpha/beta hydrolase [Granulicella arctica]